jgi:SAM-dependent methyltransferase
MRNQLIDTMVKNLLPVIPLWLRQRLWVISQGGLVRWPPIGRARPESLWRLTPISRLQGLDRGQPIDRYYIERFLATHAQDIRGRVLEIADDTYTRRLGGSRVTQSDVLHIEAGHPKTTIVADLTHPDSLPPDAFDCVICTQTLPVIYDLRAAAHTLQRILKPGGVLLATVPGISKISRYDMDRWGYYWGFTSLATQRLLAEVFGAAQVDVRAHGNVLAAVAFLHGLAAEELEQAELEYHDPDYEVNITARAVKAAAVEGGAHG